MLRNKDVFVVAIILLLATAYFYQDPEWNGNSRLELTRAIVEQGNFRIDAYHTLHDWYTEDTARYAGHYYTDKAVGSSLLAVPFYYLLYNIAAALSVPVGSVLIKHVLTTIVQGSAFAINGVTLYLIAKDIAPNLWKALVATLAVSLGTMLWPYSAVFYGHVVAGTFLIVAFYLLFSRREAPEGISGARLAWTGAAMGLAFVTEYTAAFIILGLCIYAAYVLQQREPLDILRAAVAGLLGALLPLLVMFAYNLMVYQTPFAFGYSHEASSTFEQGMSQGLMGIHFPTFGAIYHITLDPKFGLFWLSPVLVLAPVGYFMAFKRRTLIAESLVSFYSIAVMLAMNGGYYLWWGGNAFGPRLMIPMLPFFIVPLALLPDAVGPVLNFLAIISGAQMLIPLMGQIQFDLAYIPRTGLFRVGGVPFQGFSILYSYGAPLILKWFQEGKSSWNLGYAIGIPYWLSLPALLALEAFLLLWFRRLATTVPSNGNAGRTANSPKPVG